MKIKEEIKLGLNTGEINSHEDIWELELADFDKAIQLLIKHNKKSAIKEYQMLKEEFQDGERDSWYFDVSRFTRNLLESASKRSSAIEIRRIRKEIDSVFDDRRKMDLERFIKSIAEVYSSKVYNQRQIEYHTKTLGIVEKKTSALNEWFNAEALQNNLLENFTDEQQNEVRKVLQEIGEANHEDAVEKSRWG